LASRQVTILLATLRNARGIIHKVLKYDTKMYRKDNPRERDVGNKKA
jgi:hypothetical protein